MHFLGLFNFYLLNLGKESKKKLKNKMFFFKEISSLSQTINADPRFGKLAGQQVFNTQYCRLLNPGI